MSSCERGTSLCTDNGTAVLQSQGDVHETAEIDWILRLHTLAPEGLSEETIASPIVLLPVSYTHLTLPTKA